MFERLKRLYSEGKIDESKIKNAVTLKWLTEEQADEILNPPTATVVEETEEPVEETSSKKKK